MDEWDYTLRAWILANKGIVKYLDEIWKQIREAGMADSRDIFLSLCRRIIEAGKRAVTDAKSS